MYFPSPLPTTRLSISTSAVPVGPSLSAKTLVYKTPGRPSKGKFKDSLGGVQEEEGEEILDIVRGPEFADGESAGATRQTLWVALGREEVSVWSIRPKVVLAKLRRTPISLRTHGSNASVHFHGPSRLVITTSSGHHLFYSILPVVSSANKRGANEIYVLPGGEKAAQAWPRGPGEGQELEGIVLRGEGERGMAIGDGVGCVCITPSDLLVAVQDPPSLRVIPFPSVSSEASASTSLLPNFGRPALPPVQRRSSGWDSLPGLAGEGVSEAVVLDEWDWLVRRDRQDVTISTLAPLSSSSAAPTPLGPPPPYRTLSRQSSYASLSSQSLPPTGATRQPTTFVMTTSDGRAYIARWAPPATSHGGATPSGNPAGASTASLLSPLSPTDESGPNSAGNSWTWSGVCFHPASSGERGSEEWVAAQEKELDQGKGASVIEVNEPMGLVAVGCEDGTIAVYSLEFPPGQVHRSKRSDRLTVPTLSHTSSLRESLNTTASALATGRVQCLAWTSDGYGLACGWSLGWSVWSVHGRLGSWSVAGSLNGGGYGVEGEKSDSFEDGFMMGVRALFWSPGNTELFVLCPPPVHPKRKPHDEQLFVVPFAKSAVTAAHTPDNTKNAFLQMDDRVLVYRGADQPDMSVINPESDVWQHIKIPAPYIASQYPIRYAVISSDARLIAVAGQRGLTHYNALSGRWKLFEMEKEEDATKVVGGMAWWGNVLIVGCIEGGQYQLRLFSRDKPLTLADSLEIVPLDSEPLVLSVFDSSLLVYTADNTFHHFLIRHVRGSTPRLRVCGSIGFEGVVADPRKVRGLSWLVPKSQQRFGDPADDLNVATIIFLISGRLVLLRPRRAASEEVKYDLQILADQVEFYWTHLSGIGTLENSLWAWDGHKIRVWLDALTIEKVRVDARRDAYETVKESVGISLDFYPLAVLMDKGIIVGADQETSLRRSLDFAIFRIITTTHLFIHHILRFHLDRSQSREAVLFASFYQHLVYFAHALEILLHDVLEDEADMQKDAQPSALVLPRVIDFLDHFDECPQVVVNCARKTEVTRWEFLFDIVGKPRDLFEKCIASGFLKVAASYLLVLHNLEPLEQSSKDTVRLLKTAMDAGEWTLCRELLRFLYSLDRTGAILRTALQESNALPSDYFPAVTGCAPSETDEFRRALALSSSPPTRLSFSASSQGRRSEERAVPPTGRLGGLGVGGLEERGMPSGAEGSGRGRTV
ncbi:ribosome control protein 1 domain containing protein [Rhodotorula toruloides]|uniref:Ribosome control protein 1 domain containing protein n=1 Tax=Rhodotorula toruloides TaxID=5286 RepID=A0A511KFH8_RHOTO|nr:ribosome control protein 1 domain containing protein [Rhodotorula toruloides]